MLKIREIKAKSIIVKSGLDINYLVNSFENLNLYPSLRYNIFQWLKSCHPQLTQKYQEIYFTRNNYWNYVEKEIKNYDKKNNLNFKIYFHH